MSRRRKTNKFYQTLENDEAAQEKIPERGFFSKIETDESGYSYSFALFHNGQQVASGAGYSSHRFALNATSRARTRYSKEHHL